MVWRDSDGFRCLQVRDDKAGRKSSTKATELQRPWACLWVRIELLFYRLKTKQKDYVVQPVGRLSHCRESDRICR